MHLKQLLSFLKQLLSLKVLLFAFAGSMFFSSCVAKRYLVQSQAETAALREDSSRMSNKISSLEANIATLEGQIKEMEQKISTLSSQNSALGAQSAEQQNQLSQSKETLAQQQARLQQLQLLLEQQKAQSEELKNRMTEALKGFNSSDLSVYQKGGKVYVRLSENLLFPSGSAVVNPQGRDALSKLAAVLNLNSDVSVNIEGHTDSIPIRGRFQDNWDLSTARANAIVRILVNNYKVDPTRVVASGHSYYDPIDTNATSQGRAQNRRTEIILSPKLDEMYKLLGQQ